MVLTLNGIDLLSLESKLKLAIDGLEFELNDLDGEETGRAENGVMQRVKLAEAHMITLTFVPMKPGDLNLLIQECRKKFVTIAFSDPFDELNTTTAEFYNSNRNVKIKMLNRENSNVLYDNVTLKFIGRGIPLGEEDDW